MKKDAVENKKTEDDFIDKYLRKDDESLEEAKKRIEDEQKSSKRKKYSKTTLEIQEEIRKKYGLEKYQVKKRKTK